MRGGKSESVSTLFLSAANNISFLLLKTHAIRLYGLQAGWYYFVNDHLGTPQKIVNESGVVVWQAAYLPFGKAQILSGSSITNNFRFPGQYYDAETELHYNWHRYYMPTKGRYLTPDPIGLDGGINLYIYVFKNPVMLSDPYGLGTFTDIISVIPIIGTIYNIIFDPPGLSADDYAVSVDCSNILAVEQCKIDIAIQAGEFASGYHILYFVHGGVDVAFMAKTGIPGVIVFGIDGAIDGAVTWYTTGKIKDAAKEAAKKCEEEYRKKGCF